MGHGQVGKSSLEVRNAHFLSIAHFHCRKTRPISHKATAASLQTILETDLKTDELIVSRTGPDKSGGYLWLVTFAATTNSVPAFTAYGATLTGTNASASCKVVNNVAPILRSNVYLYTRTGTTWT